MSESKKREISYVEAVVSPDSFKAVKEFCEQHKIPFNVESLHCTLLYSVKCDGFQLDQTKYPMKVKVLGFDFYNDLKGNKTVCVLELEDSELNNRHKELMKVQGATYDFPAFRSHVSVAYNVPDWEKHMNNLSTQGEELEIEFVSEEYEEFQE
jgi:hypothetical protein